MLYPAKLRARSSCVQPHPNPLLTGEGRFGSGNHMGGGREIRTPGLIKNQTDVFETSALDHYAIPPEYVLCRVNYVVGLY